MAWRDWGVVKSISKFFSNSSEPTQIVIESTSKIPEATSSSAKDRKKSLIARLGLAFTKSNSSGGRDVFEEAVGFDFDEIESAYLTDSYVRQACDKYVDYMFKAGYDIVGKDAKAVEYIKLRLESMAIATQKPLGEFFNDIAEDLIKFHNVFIIKARAGNSYQYPAGITATPVLSNKTVAGYFLLPGSSITIAREPSGQVTKYKAVLVALEVDDPIVMLVAAALVANRDVAVVVASGPALLALDERCDWRALVQAGVDDLDERPAPVRRGFDFDQCHDVRPPPRS
jgi:hypothetical protein